MNWYRHPDTVDRLASEYVMGSMLPRVKRRFEQVMLQRSEVALAVEDWSERTLPLLMSLPELTPSPGMWAEVERRTQGASAAAQVAAKGASNAPDKAPWWQRWLGTVPASALAFGLVLGLALPMAVNVYRGQPADADEMQLPQSYVGVLATAEGKPGLIVSSLRKGTMVDFKELSPHRQGRCGFTAGRRARAPGQVCPLAPERAGREGVLPGRRAGGVHRAFGQPASPAQRRLRVPRPVRQVVEVIRHRGPPRP
jgi:anti-sigma-K factor RskA